MLDLLDGIESEATDCLWLNTNQFHFHQSHLDFYLSGLPNGQLLGLIKMKENVIYG